MRTEEETLEHVSSSKGKLENERKFPNEKETLIFIDEEYEEM